MKKIIISPSILSADFRALGSQMQALKDAGCDTIHADVMDGMFVPNITFGQAALKSIAKDAPLPIDVHLMINDPGRYISEFALPAVQSITVHAEACTHLDRTLQQIAECGKKPGVALNPHTPLGCLDWVLDKLWMVMIMTVNPGFGGQSFIPLFDKIAACKKLVDSRGLDTIIGIDGGVTNKNAAAIVSAGADYLVAGSYIFSGEATIRTAADALREATR
jgi:ribulose-phosphate 3-epimerase